LLRGGGGVARRRRRRRPSPRGKERDAGVTRKKRSKKKMGHTLPYHATGRAIGGTCAIATDYPFENPTLCTVVAYSSVCPRRIHALFALRRFPIDQT
jgi:hypothetical protein